MGNYAFIDGQNLHLGTSSEGWSVDVQKFRAYLTDKYNIVKAYYYLGYVQDNNNSLYTKLQESGFIVVFKKQMLDMKTKKKGNIDSDLIFNVMEKLIEAPGSFEKIILVSGDGDFKILVDYLIKKDRLLKIIFPNKKYASSLYNGLASGHFDYLKNVQNKIQYKTKKKVP